MKAMAGKKPEVHAGIECFRTVLTDADLEYCNLCAYSPILDGSDLAIESRRDRAWHGTFLDMTFGFASGFLGVGSKQAQCTPRCSRRARGPRMEISVLSIVSEGLVAVGIAAGVTYWLKTPMVKEGSEEAASFMEELGFKEESAVETKESPAEPKDDAGVLGLMGGSRSEPRKAAFSSAKEPPASPTLESLLPKTPSANERRRDEVMWAIGTLADMGAVSCVAVDSSGDIVIADGELVASPPGLTGILQRVAEVRNEEVLEVSDNEKCQFLQNTVRSVACFPCGNKGAVLVASSEKGFFGDFELRILRALVTRLSFSIDPPSGDDASVDALPGDEARVDTVSVDVAAAIEEAR